MHKNAKTSAPSSEAEIIIFWPSLRDTCALPLELHPCLSILSIKAAMVVVKVRCESISPWVCRQFFRFQVLETASF